MGSDGKTTKKLVMEELFRDKEEKDKGKKASLPDKLEVLVPGPDGVATAELTVYPDSLSYCFCEYCSCSRVAAF